MITLTGTSVFPGVAAGPLHFLPPGGVDHATAPHDCDDPAAEVARLEAARAVAVAELGRLHDKALADVGEANAAIFEVHQMMLEDPDFVEAAIGIIETERVNAEHAAHRAGETFAAIFEAMDDPYMRGRAADVRDIAQRLIGVLAPESDAASAWPDEPVILAAADLTPSQTVQLDRGRVLAFATAFGSTTSHTAILARTLAIPALVDVGAELTADLDGRPAILDGFTGTLHVDPDDATRATLAERQGADQAERALLADLKGKPNVTLDGHAVTLYANAGSIADLASVLDADADGIGLFRSEFVYLDRAAYPTEQEQFEVYLQVLQTMGGRKVVIRTLDIGADKQAGYFDLAPEENPALGLRAIRLCLTRPDLFRTQLRALLRASAFGRLAIMFPMITSAAELDRIDAVLTQVKGELTVEGIPFADPIETGVMIETPAAALIADDLARRVDFFSVGTNDLTQYTLALDRQNHHLAPFYDPAHPAVLRLIELAARAAHRAGIWIGVCGELAADPAMTEWFLRAGVDELSVAPGHLLRIRHRIRTLDLAGDR
ncbi:MAG: phosphoenolpyruvate--protein phosphotransferase [Propionibacteriaceae bacterium]|jgi:phosphotransferase system enzyme I (PtsI)|nr:phosphoenolpyruvate--protein phosphotransferase [Propionibacteriaceae bacterium]